MNPSLEWTSRLGGELCWQPDDATGVSSWDTVPGVPGLDPVENAAKTTTCFCTDRPVLVHRRPLPLRWHQRLLRSGPHRFPPVRTYSPGPPQTAATRLTPLAAPVKPATAPASSMQTGTVSREAPPSGRHRYQVGGGGNGDCFFQTARVKAEGPQNSLITRILLDGGSDSSYIRSSLAEELGLPVVGTGTFSCIGFQE